MWIWCVSAGATVEVPSGKVGIAPVKVVFITSHDGVAISHEEMPFIDLDGNLCAWPRSSTSSLMASAIGRESFWIEMFTGMTS